MNDEHIPDLCDGIKKYGSKIKEIEWVYIIISFIIEQTYLQ